MNTIRQLACTPVVNGVPTLLDFTGEDVGPFFIHRDRPDDLGISPADGWSVTHVATGFAVQKRISSKVRAFDLAHQLVDLDCWDFETPEAVKSLPAEKLKAIHALRAAA